ncbi:hypothetical protein ACTS9U_16695 [Empedobacter falsenii]
MVDKASKTFSLRQRELITLGIIAQNDGISATDLSIVLNVNKPNGLQSWLGRLLDLEILHSKGKTKGTIYYVNPEVLRDAEYFEKTNLKRIEPHRLQELIYEDLKNYPKSSIGDICKRIGEEIKQRTIKSKLDEMVEKALLIKEGEKRWTTYSINKKP